MIAACAALLCSAVAASASPPAARRARMCLGKVTDATGRASARRIGRTLERALRRDADYLVVSGRSWARAARRRRISRRRWRRTRTVRRLGLALRLDVVLFGSLRRHRRRYRLTLTALDGGTAEKLATRVIELRRPSLSNVQARQAVSELGWALTLARAPGPAVASARSARESEESAKAAKAQALDQRPAARAPGARERTDAVPAPSEAGTSPAGESDTRTTADEAWSAAEEGWDTPGDKPAGEATGGNGSASPAVSGEGLRLSGRVVVEHFSYLESLGEDKAGGRNNIDFALEAGLKSQRLDVVARALFRHDFSNRRRDRAEAEEAYVDLRLGPLTIRAGRVIVAWGTANSMNPTDVINPIDLRDPLDPERRGSWMVRAGLLLGPVLLEGYYLPVPESNLLALPDAVSESGELVAPWRFVPPRLPGPRPELPLQVDLDLGGPPSSSLENTQLALRASLVLPGVDLAASYLYRFDRMPTFRITSEPIPAAAPTAIEGQFSLEYRRVHLVTFEGEAAFGRWRVAAESLLFLSDDWGNEDDALVNPFASAVGGVDYRTAQFFGDHRLHLFADLWVSGFLVGGRGEDPVGQLRLPFDYALLGRVRYELGDDLRIDINVFTALNRYDLMLNTQVEYTLFDRATLQGGAEVLLGKRDQGFFGPFRDNTRITARLEVSF